MPRRSESMTGITGLAATAVPRPAGAARASPRGKRDTTRGGGQQLRGRGSLAGVADQDKPATSPRRGRSQAMTHSGAPALHIGNSSSFAAHPEQAQQAQDRGGTLVQRGSVSRRMSHSG